MQVLVVEPACPPKARPQIKQEAGAASADEAKQKASAASASEAKQEASAASAGVAATGEVEEKSEESRRRSWKRWKESLEEESLGELEQSLKDAKRRRVELRWRTGGSLLVEVEEQVPQLFLEEGGAAAAGADF